MSKDQRIAEIEALATEEGLTLPMPAATIADIEEAGGMVDLENGRVLWNGTEFPVGLLPTAFGEAVVHLLDLGVEVGL